LKAKGEREEKEDGERIKFALVNRSRRKDFPNY
jgi:hypothetical protein